ncbi:hypothetical protein GC173_05530 [bacterium]|nr:hypothetical protein [bacterium]
MSRGPAVAYYLSGHGFGHATRAVLVMEALHRLAPGVQLHIRSTVQESLLRKYLRLPFTLERVQLDSTVIERSIFAVDVPATAAAYRAWAPTREVTIAAETASMRSAGIDVTVFDVPPAAAAASAAAGIPSVAITNFTWDYIYDDYRAEDPVFAEAVRQCRADYALADLALQLPLGHTFDQFRRTVAVPLVARRTAVDREAIRAELGIHDSRPVLVVALRGAATGLSVDGRDVQVLSFGELDGPGVRRLEPAWDQRFSEVLAAGDVVLSKPGYGVCSECIANGKPLLHLPRTGFREADLLVRGMDGAVPHAQIDAETLADGTRLALVCRDLMQSPVPPSADVSGADACARMILEVAGLANGDLYRRG